jgi:hypothetical protein
MTFVENCQFDLPMGKKVPRSFILRTSNPCPQRRKYRQAVEVIPIRDVYFDANSTACVANNRVIVNCKSFRSRGGRACSDSNLEFVSLNIRIM